jgi:hypothetical protein
VIHVLPSFVFVSAYENRTTSAPSRDVGDIIHASAVGQLLKALAASAGIVGTVSLALLYFIPAPPSKVTMATGERGSSFEYYGRQYRQISAF